MQANSFVEGKDYVAGCEACKYVSSCTKVLVDARGLYPCMPRETSSGEKRFLEKEPGLRDVSRLHPYAFKPKECNYREDQSQRNDVRDSFAYIVYVVVGVVVVTRNLNIDRSIRRLTPVTAAFATFPPRRCHSKTSFTVAFSSYSRIKGDGKVERKKQRSYPLSASF